MPSPKQLPHEQNEQVRVVLRRIVAEEFGGTVTHAAKALGISHSIIHETLSGSRGAGMKVLRALSEHTGRSIDDILHGIERDRGPRTGGTIGEHPDFKVREQELRARLRRRGVTPNEAVMRELPTWGGSRALPALTVDFLLKVYEALQQGAEDNWTDPEQVPELSHR